MRYNFEKLIRKLMVLGWSQNEVVDRIRKRVGEDDAISQATVSHVLTGKNQNPPTVKKVADALGVDMEELLPPRQEKLPPLGRRNGNSIPVLTGNGHSKPSKKLEKRRA